MKRYTDPKGTLVFIMIAAFLMVAATFFLDSTTQIPSSKTTQTTPSNEYRVDISPQFLDTPIANLPSDTQPKPQIFSSAEWAEIQAAFEEPYLEYESPVEPSVEEKIKEPAEKPPKKSVEKKPQKLERKITKKIKPYRLPDGSKPKIAIIIDDMGMNRKLGYTLINMDAPLTLAFLPYAPSLSDITKEAQDKGHELMIHMPMEPLDSKQNLGGIALRDKMDSRAIQEQLEQAFAAFDGYVGLNNHMGSRITQNETAMNAVMQSLQGKDLYFVDSKTIGSSVAAQAAWNNGLRVAERDVFLDHEDNISFVRNALKKTENVAKRQGYAIAIGHPKGNTIQGLKEWLPTLEAKGFEIVPASQLVKRDNTLNLLAQKEITNIEPAAGSDEAGIQITQENLIESP